MRLTDNMPLMGFVQNVAKGTQLAGIRLFAKQIPEFVMAYGDQGDLEVISMFDVTVLRTAGTLIQQCEDQEYLLKTILPRLSAYQSGKSTPAPFVQPSQEEHDAIDDEAVSAAGETLLGIMGLRMFDVGSQTIDPIPGLTWDPDTLDIGEPEPPLPPGDYTVKILAIEPLADFPMEPEDGGAPVLVTRMKLVGENVEENAFGPIGATRDYVICDDEIEALAKLFGDTLVGARGHVIRFTLDSDEELSNFQLVE